MSQPIYIQPDQQKECLPSSRSMPQLRLYQPGYVYNSVEPVNIPHQVIPSRSAIPALDTSMSPTPPQTPDEPVSPRWRARQILSARWSLPTPPPTGWNINPTPPVPAAWSEGFAQDTARSGWLDMQQRDQYIELSKREDRHQCPSWFRRRLTKFRRILSVRPRREEIACYGCDCKYR
ncbi:hypothetical protein Slin15195_G021940 [Septoria linicola]|uniref:Uncharacterized protein n=1 Tax=Septoria linicola TaxID=215465 RepID=A0A9Q9AGX7_9PEZI|nr:hypothetical protein Slin14017_G130410 [Septoria linicola]USW48875.1 hypothetical protein Slin15195_G021940 [Septoria linicola]